MMRLRTFLIGLLIGTANIAQADEAATISRVLDTLCINLTDALGCEQVTLLASSNGELAADLFIMPNVQNNDTTPIFKIRNAVWSGAHLGDITYLDRTDTGSLRIISEQIGSGRDPWTQTLTIAARDGEILVAGYTFTTYDRLDNSTFKCDVNLITGGFEATASPPQVDLDTGDLINDSSVFTETGRSPATAHPIYNLSYQDRPPEICVTMRAKLDN